MTPCRLLRATGEGQRVFGFSNLCGVSQEYNHVYGVLQECSGEGMQDVTQMRTVGCYTNAVGEGRRVMGLNHIAARAASYDVVAKCSDR